MARTRRALKLSADNTRGDAPATRKRQKKNPIRQQAASGDDIETSKLLSEQGENRSKLPSATGNPSASQDDETLLEAHDHGQEDSCQATVPLKPDEPAASDNTAQRPTKRPKVMGGLGPDRVGYKIGFNEFAPDDKAEGERWDDEIIKPQTSGMVLQYLHALNDAIERFVFHGFPQKCAAESLGDATLQKLSRLSPHARLMVQDPVNGAARRFFAAWIWRILYDNLFSTDCLEKWKPGPWEYFGKLIQSLQGSTTDEDDEFNLYHLTSKYRHARVLYTKFAEHTDRKRLKDIILDELHPILDVKRAKKLDELVEDVVHRAVRLDLQMISSTFEYEMVMHDPASGKLHGFPVGNDERLLKSYSQLSAWEESSELKADLILKPSLREYGIEDPCIGDTTRVSNRWFCRFFTPLEVESNMYPEVRYGMTRDEYFAMQGQKEREWRAARAKKRKQNKAEGKEAKVDNSRPPRQILFDPYV